jgi:biopolymer transport protein ExbD
MTIGLGLRININQSIVNDDEFDSKLKSIYLSRPDKNIFIRADSRLYLSNVLLMINHSKKVGVKTICLIPEII